MTKLDLRALHKRAGADFGRAVAAIRPDQWELPTPCTEWNVRQVVNHMVYENRWTPEMLAGKTIEQVGDSFDGDLLGDDPKEAWADSMRAAEAAVARDDALTTTVHASFGDIPGEVYISQLFLDLLIHGWDVARGTRQDDSLDPELVQACWRIAEPQRDLIRASGVFGAEVEAPEDDLQARLLGLLGRRA